MIYTCTYNSMVGKLLLVSKNNKLIGVYIEDGKDDFRLKEEFIEKPDEEILLKTCLWLDRYFLGEKPSIEELEIEFVGSEFSKIVWNLLCKIPYGKTTTYKSIAKSVASIMGEGRMSCQAVGNAIGKNQFSIIVPCHRVVGTDGNLTGYAWGLDKKKALLELEKVDMTNLFIKERKK